jgi:dipeptidyl aminopeptidase/acylaminoacyl peptidase
MRRVLWLISLFIAVSVTGAAPGQAVAASGPYQVAVQPITVTVDGQPATGLLYLPYSQQPGDLPVNQLVVFCHGHTDTAATEASYLIPLAAHTGAPVLAMNNRGAPGAWNPTTGWQDTLAATRWYKHQHPGIRLTVLWGWSMGGMTSGLALAHEHHRLFDYWVASFPVVEDAGACVVYKALGAVDGEPGAGQEVQNDAGGCNPAQCPTNYMERSPTFLAARIHVRRAIFLHGLGDDNSPYEQSREMQAALQVHGIPTSMYSVATYRNSSGQVEPAGHGFGPVADEAQAVVERILAGTEPITGRDREYVIDDTTGARLGAPG